MREDVLRRQLRDSTGPIDIWVENEFFEANKHRQVPVDVILAKLESYDTNKGYEKKIRIMQVISNIDLSTSKKINARYCSILVCNLQNLDDRKLLTSIILNMNHPWFDTRDTYFMYVV